MGDLLGPLVIDVKACVGSVYMSALHQKQIVLLDAMNRLKYAIFRQKNQTSFLNALFSKQ